MYSNYYVDYSDCQSIENAVLTITENEETAQDKATAIYKYLICELSYDSEKAKNISCEKLEGYIPSPEETLDSKNGICCDFASLYAAMLRSLDIPCKVVYGYCDAFGDTYHAWNSVYDSVSDEWITVDLTRGIIAGSYFGNGWPQESADEYMECICY